MAELLTGEVFLSLSCVVVTGGFTVLASRTLVHYRKIQSCRVCMASSVEVLELDKKI
jgi:hypothetical protein